MTEASLPLEYEQGMELPNIVNKDMNEDPVGSQHHYYHCDICKESVITKGHRYTISTADIRGVLRICFACEIQYGLE